MADRLTEASVLAPGVLRPAYDRAGLEAGILHLGPGAFFRAHSAVYTDDALTLGDTGWGIVTGGLRSSATADVLDEQNGLYTLLVRDADKTQARVIGSVIGGVAPSDLLSKLCDPAIRIVSMTVTEKAYGMDPVSGGLNVANPDIAANLKSPDAPRSVVGLLVEGLRQRRARGIVPFTPLCCDNLPENGSVLKRLVLQFAERLDPGLAGWIADNVPFPSTMVDRITPASTPETYADAVRLTGFEDLATVEAEPFSQWVVEDRFAAGRPAWERVGVLMVDDVSPYEKMKLRMLNGTHSLLAYLGFLAGYDYIRDAIADERIGQAARHHIEAAAGTLDPVAGVDLRHYGEQLAARFANRAILHKTAQVAMDGTQKLPQRLLEPAVVALERGSDAQSFALAVAAWMRYVAGATIANASYSINDPREQEIRQILAGTDGSAEATATALFSLPGLFPDALRNNRQWREAVVRNLDGLQSRARP